MWLLNFAGRGSRSQGYLVVFMKIVCCLLFVVYSELKKTGTKGEPVTISSNYIPIQCKNEAVFQYHVSFTYVLLLLLLPFLYVLLTLCNVLLITWGETWLSWFCYLFWSFLFCVRVAIFTLICLFVFVLCWTSGQTWRLSVWDSRWWRSIAPLQERWWRLTAPSCIFPNDWTRYAFEFWIHYIRSHLHSGRDSRWLSANYVSLVIRRILMLCWVGVLLTVLEF